MRKKYDSLGKKKGIVERNFESRERDRGREINMLH